MRTIRTNDRAQNVVLGTILVFGFLITGLGIYQTTVVPNQNAGVELNHAEEVDEDFSELYAGANNAAEQRSEYTANIKLGTQYPPRALTLNPPAASGSIRTTELGEIEGEIEIDDPPTGFSNPIDIENDFCGLGEERGGDPLTKALVYDPDYNELDGIGVHGYEYSSRYQEVDDSVTDTDQQLVNGRNINLRPITAGSISRTSASSTTVSFKTDQTGGKSVTATDEWELQLPTRLSDDKWEEILREEIDDGPIKSVDESGGVLTIKFSSGDYRIRCTPLGVDETPSNDPRLILADDDDTDDPASINPVGPQALELRSVSKDNKAFDANFNNRGPSKTVQKVRVPYVVNPGSNFDGVVSLSKNGDETTVTVGQGFDDNIDWEWSSGEDDNVIVEGENKNIKPNQAGVAVVFEFENGERTTYFIGLSD